MRLRAGQSESLRQSARAVQRRADHRRQRLGSRLLHAAAHGGRAGAACADRQRRERMEGAGGRAHDRKGRRRSPQVEAAHQLRRHRQVRQGAGRSAEDHRGRPQEAEGLQADRPQGDRPRRCAVEGQRQRQVRHRRAGAGHDLRLGARSPDGRLQGRSPQHGRRRQDQGRDARHAAAVRRRGAGRDGGGHARRPQCAQGQVGHRRRDRGQHRLREGEGGVRPPGQGSQRQGDGSLQGR